jgi:hypothetical protein
VAVEAFRVQVKCDLGFQKDFLVEQEIPLGVGTVRIAIRILNAKFLDQTGFSRAHFPAVKIGANDVHANFARCIAPEYGPVLDEGDAQTISRRGQRRTDAGHTAANDTKIDLKEFR